jgi:hypothetical protein
MQDDRACAQNSVIIPRKIWRQVIVTEQSETDQKAVLDALSGAMASLSRHAPNDDQSCCSFGSV